MDVKERKMELTALIVYALAALITVGYTRESITFSNVTDILLSIAFGIVIYLLSFFSDEGIGLADGVYFVINGLLLTLKENLLLFLTGMFVAFVIGIFLYYFGNIKSRKESRIPFLPCFLPAIIGYIICIV
jgi:peptidoglycan/LPS O-acetylase OafA/YrhL